MSPSRAYALWISQQSWLTASPGTIFTLAQKRGSSLSTRHTAAAVGSGSWPTALPIGAGFHQASRSSMELLAKPRSTSAGCGRERADLAESGTVLLRSLEWRPFNSHPPGSLPAVAVQRGAAVDRMPGAALGAARRVVDCPDRQPAG